MNIGNVYSALGQKLQALDYFNQSLRLFRAVDDRFGVAGTLMNIGNVYSALGQKLQALDYFNQSLRLFRAVGTRSLEPPTAQKLVKQQQTVLAFGNPVPREPQNLPGAEEEVKNITQLFSGSEAYLGNNATLNKFKTYASRFPLLHLATHGCFQNQDCKKINLKKNTLLFADTQFDIADAARLGLQGTQLLTLSACQTAQETNSSGEGIVGVAYIFERAGAKAVMAGLWAVEDEATRNLMIDFYQNLKQGMSKGEALQKAKLKQIDRHPYYWSPFVLIGDAR
jgi:CHAT domain-containing protein